MSTRLRRPSLWRQLAITGALVAFQGYLGWSAIGGNFGIESQKLMQVDIASLKVRSAGLDAEIDVWVARVVRVARPIVLGGCHRRSLQIGPGGLR